MMAMSYPFDTDYICPYCNKFIFLTMPDDWEEFVMEEINCPNCNETGLFIWEEFNNGWEGYMLVKKDYYD